MIKINGLKIKIMKNTKISLFLFFMCVISTVQGQVISGSSCVTSTANWYEYVVSHGDSIVWTASDGIEFPASYQGYTLGTSIQVKLIDGNDEQLYANVYVWEGSRYYFDGIAEKDINFSGAISFSSSPSDILYVGNYQYSITPVPGATSYSWLLPSGWSGSSSTNSITAYASSSAQPGNIQVTVNGGDLCEHTATVDVELNACFGKHIGEYNPNSISSRVVVGDFDNDGLCDDVAGFYNYGNNNTAIHVWESNGSAFTYQGDNGWWSSSNYNALNLVGVVSGDFDRDGFQDDIAAFYNYGNNVTKIHVWKSNGSSFIYQGDNGFWSSTTYNASQILDRVVSGDFDRDGYIDDIAAFYNYGNNITKIHIWESTGSSLTYQGDNGFWSSTTYTAGNISGRVVSGDFDSDGYFDDIASFYNYGNFNTELHTWVSSGTSFTFGSKWTASSYDPEKIKYCVISGNFDNDNYSDDIAAFYNYGSGETRLHVWTSQGGVFNSPATSGWWSSTDYDATKIARRVVSGDFNTSKFLRARKDHICAFYDYQDNSTSMHVWKSNGTSFVYQGDDGWWSVCNPVYSNIPNNNINNSDLVNKSASLVEDNYFEFFPNPTFDKIYCDTKLANSVINIYSANGQKILSRNCCDEQIEIDVSYLPNGIYFIQCIVGENNSQVEKLMIQK